MYESGFCVKQDVLAASECNRLIEYLREGNQTRGRAGARNLMAQADVYTIANDPRLLQIASCALGRIALPYRAILFDKSTFANWFVRWHQDTALPLTSQFHSSEWGPWSRKAGVLFARAPAWALSRVVALRLHLDASTTDNGALRVIPGTHRLGVLSSEEVTKAAQQRSSVECLADRGGILVMSPLLIHSSSRARLKLPRRVLHIEYADSMRLADNICLAKA